MKQKTIVKILILILAIISMGLIISVDWKIALGLFIWTWAMNMEQGELK